MPTFDWCQVVSPPCQSRTQSPQAPWSAVWSPGETLGKWNFFPPTTGVPVVVRMLSFIKTEVNVSREVGESLGYLQ